MRKRMDGRQEPIVEPDLPIVDAHHHLFDRNGHRYLLDEILDDVSAGHDVRATVYIESQYSSRTDGPELLRPVGETEFARRVAEECAARADTRCQVNAAIVAYADLTQGVAVAETLDAHAAAGGRRFRGIRQIALWHPDPAPYRYVFNPPAKGLMTSPGFREGFMQLAQRNLTFDAVVFHTQIRDVVALADAFPDTTIVLGHLGFAMGMDMDEEGRSEVFRQWRSALKEAAWRPNIVTKIGGLGTPFWGFGFDQLERPATSDELAETWRPYVETAIQFFSPDRCLMESNFPVDGHSCGYVPLWNALKKIAAGYSVDEKLKLFANNAARIYRIEI